MTRTAFVVLVALALGGCGTAEPRPARVQDAPALRYRTCQVLSPPLPKVRTVESLNERNAELEGKYPDCAERMRLSVSAFDALKAAFDVLKARIAALSAH